VARRATTDRAVASFVAKTCLEIERGLRPPDHLRTFLHPATAEHRQASLKTGHFRGGPAVRQDIGPPHLSRLSPRHAVVTIVTRTEGRRWGALALQFRIHHIKWYVTRLERLLAAAHYRSGPVRAAPIDVSLDDHIRLATNERRLIDAALAATEQRL